MIDRVVRAMTPRGNGNREENYERRDPGAVRRPIDLDASEAEAAADIEAGMRQMHSRTPLPPDPGLGRPVDLPEYVTHSDGINAIGKVTAAAVIQDYEETAKKIDEAGTELKALATRLEDYLKECMLMVEHISRASTTVRERGAEIFRRVEESAKATENVRGEIDKLTLQITSVPLLSDPAHEG